MSERTCPEWQALLAEAEAAQHSLLLGGVAVRVRDGPSEVEFSAVNLPRLERLIAFYRGKVDACLGNCTRGRRVIRFVPG